MAPAVDSTAERATPAQVAYWRRAFPTAKEFGLRMIPKEMLRTADQGNERYVRVTDANGDILGFLRDFNGPVSLSEQCPCSPLSLTLVFDKDFVFQTIISEAPLEKYGHEFMTESDRQRLIEIVKDPPAELLEVPSVEAMVVDGMMGATKAELKPHVVPQAALSTKRIVTLARDTQKILQGALIQADFKQLAAINEQSKNDLELVKALSAFQKDAETEEVRIQTYRRVAQLYVSLLRNGTKPLAEIDDRLLRPKLPQNYDAIEVLIACYRIAETSAHPQFADKCLADAKRLAQADRVLVDLLKGTALYFRGDKVRAAPLLKEAATTLTNETEPALHLRLVDALVAGGKTGEACDVAQALFLAQPLFPGAVSTLGACPEGAQTVEKQLREQQKKRFLSGDRGKSIRAPKIAVEDEKHQAIDLALFAPGKTTVAVFFATWCPHCKAELPRIIDFVKKLKNDNALQKKVTVLGIRTAVDKEKESYAAFLQKTPMNFPVYTDATMSLALASFAKALTIRAGIPIVAVMDAEGFVRFLLENGEYRDIETELRWAVESLVGKK